ncbi:MAG: hypothetical protein O3C57_07685, partial [Verrucomicrobia bacterium]|nr:hypothetical protein [Verrucomicrobiota bacterium]
MPVRPIVRQPAIGIRRAAIVDLRVHVHFAQQFSLFQVRGGDRLAVLVDPVGRIKKSAVKLNLLPGQEHLTETILRFEFHWLFGSVGIFSSCSYFQINPLPGIFEIIRRQG